VRLDKLWLADFRSYESAELALAPGLTAVLGDNGQGKSNLLEAVAWLATLESFRGAPTEALVRAGAAQAILRAEGRVADDVDALDGGRMALIEAELLPAGRNRVQVNRQRLQRTRDLLGVLRVSVFTPDDSELVKGGPGGRRRYLDQTLVSLHARYDAVRSEVERVLKQRNALLRQVQGDGHRLDESASTTLDVWDQKLAEAGEELARLRIALVERLSPALEAAYAAVAVGAEARARVGIRYDSAWHGAPGGLEAALAAGRRDDIRRGVSLVGPHRDDLMLTVGGTPARTHASQGEQRSLALALRLAAHAVVSDTAGTAPLLLLDDVFSELDRRRADALVASLPPGQALLTSATGLPAGATPEHVLRIDAVDDEHGGVRSTIVDVA
jgi:DNA replication and repair protein RecF